MCTAVVYVLNKATQLYRVILNPDLYIRSLFHGSFMVRNVISPDSEVLWFYKIMKIIEEACCDKFLDFWDLVLLLHDEFPVF
jgi:hypothetical protein